VKDSSLRSTSHAERRPSAGARAEALAVAFLARHGLEIVARNFRTRFGEIDVIAREGATLVFVEVRLRRSGAFGGAASSITAAKRNRLVKAARGYLATLAKEPPCRFDALFLDALSDERIDWQRDVFDVT
jgi:putative endonuclease